MSHLYTFSVCFVWFGSALRIETIRRATHMTSNDFDSYCGFFQQCKMFALFLTKANDNDNIFK